jgi:iron complex outermembrane receptor protein
MKLLPSSGILFVSLLFCALVPSPAAEGPATQPSAADSAPVRLDPIFVTANKRDELLQEVPQSATVVTGQTIQEAGITSVKEASYLAPNVLLQEFSARRLSFPFIRGIGSGRNSPAVTTYIDGVPQLSFATSNQELLDVERIEFLRGPQGTLYGRNTLGGVINILTRKPTNDFYLWGGATFGNYDLQDYRLSFMGPIKGDELYIGLAGGYSTRDGYTINDLTGNDLDSREAVFGRAQLLWTPADRLEVRLILSGERARDGDYALGDLAQIRHRPHHVSHDFEGSTRRDIVQPALIVTYTGYAAQFTSVSSFQYWESKDITDLDAGPLDILRRQNAENQRIFTQEVRVASLADEPARLGDDAKLSWLLGAFFFTSRYEQDAFNEFRPGAAAVGIPFAFTQFEDSQLDDYGIAVFGQTTLTLWDKLDLTVGLRVDHEHKEADVGSSASIPFIPSASASDSDDFTRLVPRAAIAYRWREDLMTYASVAHGFKAGGFNTASAPPGRLGFDQETSWTYEVGVKKSWLQERLITNLALFHIDWKDMQLDVPSGSPGIAFVDNAGDATSQGIELEVLARPVRGLDLFGSFGYVDAEFDNYVQPNGRSAAGNDLPFAPRTMWNLGAHYSLRLFDEVRAFARAEATGIGQYFYDASNAAGERYTIADFRLGVGQRSRTVSWRVEGWVRNAFDEEYVPLAFPFPFAPSGYVGESGAPRTYGVSLSMEF